MSKPRPGPTANPLACAAVSFTEAPAWSAIGAGWRPLFGGLRGLGFSFEEHDFTTETDLDWARSFHPNSLELCLNLEGQATLTDARQTVEVRPRTRVFYFQGTPPLVATRRAGEPHRFITVEFTVEFLKQHLQHATPHLHPCVQAALTQSAPASVVTVPEPMGSGCLQLMECLQHCPVFKPAQETWFRCKALEVGYSSLSHFTVAFREAFGCCPGLYPVKSTTRLPEPRPASPKPPA